MSLTDLLLPTYKNMLQMLLGLLDKAEQQVVDHADGLLSARLAPDMYPLASQVCFAAYQAQEATFRLRGEDIPQSLADVAAEGRNTGTVAGSIADARSRIAEALARLDSLSDNALDTGAALRVTIELPGNIAFDMTGEQYARDWALPQFYFHVITAYAILRHHGIALGKADYVPHMFAYLLPGPLPSA